MRLASIFIYDENLDDGGKVVNLGGYYDYLIKQKDGELKITTVTNESYIPNFFDQSGIIQNISAIVGKNGSGKTTLIKEIINVLVGHHNSGFSIWETADNEYFISGFNINLRKIIYVGKKPFQKEVGLNTIYYSPHLDHKSRVNGIDISADRYLAEDLNNIDNTFDLNTRVVIEDRLKRSNYNRFITFQKSKFIDHISHRYGLLKDPYYRVTFTRHKIDATKTSIDFDNTPREFRFFLENLYYQIRSEYDNFDRVVDTNEQQYELNKKQMKNIILMDMFCLLLNLMEVHNTYLEEGHFTLSKTLIDTIISSNQSPYQKMLLWLENYEYSKGEKKPLPDEEVLNILGFIFEYIDSLEYNNKFNLLDWRNKSIYFEESELYQLLELNLQLLLALPKYYGATDSQRSTNGPKYSIHEELSHLQIFANFEFASRQLSSGETAMLNLFSKIYDFFRRNLMSTITVPKDDYYVLFLDEADLGFHPDWKRTYISSVIEFCKDFFNQPEVNALVQIVFLYP